MKEYLGIDRIIRRGKISYCPFQGCEYKCCKFQQGNFIVMYPGELQEAHKNGFSMSHLEIISEDCFGGVKTVCNAQNKACCDDGYKPLDCASYPLFPASIKSNGDIALSIIKGHKCPLEKEELQKHIDWFTNEWKNLFKKNPDISTWLLIVDLVDYEEFTRPFQEVERLAVKP